MKSNVKSILLSLLILLLSTHIVYSQIEEKRQIARYYNEQALDGYAEYSLKLKLYPDSTYHLNSFVHFGPHRHLSDSGTWIVKKNHIFLNSFYYGAMKTKVEKRKKIYKKKKFKFENNVIYLSRFFLDRLYLVD